MEFLVLGPLKVRAKGRDLTLGTPAERHLLAVLLVYANDVVSIERLIDELWSDDPPPSARNMVHRYVSRLRTTLGDPDGGRLATEPPGYRLRVETDELDAERFARLAAEGRDAPSPAAAAALLRESLGLWRGVFLDGIAAGSAVGAERVRWEEARLATLEEAIEADLALGHHSALVPELQALTGRYPLRERFWALLMLALHRCGRRAEALRTFATYRDRLGEETGLDPSAELFGLEERILLDDPVVAAPSRQLPPSRSVEDSHRHNLPVRLTEFIGRRREIAAVADRIRQYRLVTLIGAGGVGKTSLAIRVAADNVSAFPGGAWLVALAGIPEPDSIGSAVAGAVGIKQGPGENVTKTLTRHLAGIATLLVLDNCEHLIDGVAKFAATVLAAVPTLRILATSREPLAISGEATFIVPSLELPASTDRATAELAAAEAVALFLDRAQLQIADFSLDDDNASAVVEICRRLDGIPLAIELAAARLHTLSPGGIAAGLDDRFHLLTRGSRTAPSRHQTLQALIDWSHDLLTDAERVLLRRLAVFGGGFTLEATEHVCGFDPVDKTMVGDLLERLSDTSMVISPQPPGSRYGMLETIREYARHRLTAAGETSHGMKRLAAYLELAAPGSWVDLNVPDPIAWYRWLDQERDNYRACLTWAVATKNKATAARVAIDFQEYLTHAGHPAEAATWTAAALDLLGDEPTCLRARLLGIAAHAHLSEGDHGGARHLIERLRADAKGLGDEAAVGMAVWMQALLAERAGDLSTADTLHAEAERRLRAAGDPRFLNAMGGRAVCLIQMGRFQEAEDVLECLESAREDGPGWSIAAAANLRAWIDVLRGNYDEAQLRLHDARADIEAARYADLLFQIEVLCCDVALQRGELDVARDVVVRCQKLADEHGIGAWRYSVERLRGLIELEAARPDAAARHIGDAIKSAEVLADRTKQAEVLAIAGDIALKVGDPAEAALLHAVADAVRHRAHQVLGQWSQQRRDHALSEVRGAIDSASLDQIWSAGKAIPLEEALDQGRRFIEGLVGG